MKYCPNCRKVVNEEQVRDGKCLLCGTDVTPIPPFTAPLPVR